MFIAISAMTFMNTACGTTRFVTELEEKNRYFSFGIRKNWMDLFFQDEGLADFWMSDGHGLVANKKKDAFLNFVKDAGLVEYDKTLDGDKYTKNIPTTFARAAFSIGSDSDVSWALMLCNLAYTSEFNWFIKNIPALQQITPDQMKYMLSEVMEGDTKGNATLLMHSRFCLLRHLLDLTLDWGILTMKKRLTHQEMRLSQ